MTHRRFLSSWGGSTCLLALLSVAAMSISFSEQRSSAPPMMVRCLTLLIMAIGITAMALRTGRPLLALSMVAGAYLPAVALHAEQSMAIPYSAVLHSCLVRTSARRAAAGVAGTLALVTVPAVMERPDSDDEGLLLAGRAGAVLCVVMAGLMARVWRARQESLREAERERLRADRVAQQRDRSIERERLAVQLHDSVGHCLTTIIALSEGLTDLSTDPDCARAVQGINSLAREGLGETRQVVESLGTTQSSGPGADVTGSGVGTVSQQCTAQHGWDDVGELLDHVRASGIITSFTEEGARPAGENGGLCFSLTREALTNCLRHGAGITHIAVLWRHHPDGSTHVLVEDDGDVRGREGKEPCSGTGLRRHRDLILARHGDFYAGSPDGSGWVIDATVAPEGAERATAP